MHDAVQHNAIGSDVLYSLLLNCSWRSFLFFPFIAAKLHAMSSYNHVNLPACQSLLIIVI